MKQLNDVINSGVDFLARQQAADGSFPSLTSADPINFIGAYRCHTVFSTSLILQALLSLGSGNGLPEVISKAGGFLQSEKSDNWTFNYWSRRSPDYLAMPYPEDLDDTACSLAALYLYDKNLIDGEVLGRFVAILTALEEAPGGPYRTWLVTKEAEKVWRHVDLAVNANIGYLLSLVEADLPTLNAYIDKAIAMKDFSSPYYSSIYPVIYFISRYHQGEGRERLRAFLLEQRDHAGRWGNLLDTALAVSALFNLGAGLPEAQRGCEYILEQSREQNWQPQPFYVGVKRDQDGSFHAGPEKFYAGSQALTAVLCLEAMGKYRKEITGQRIETRESKEGARAERIKSRVIEAAQNYAESLPVELRFCFKMQFETTLQSDRNSEILLLPYFFASSLEYKDVVIPDELLINLGTVNLLGWMAYTIYDDFLDEEGKPGLLPLANVLLMELNALLGRINPAKVGFFNRLMLGLEEANIWEINHCRVKFEKFTEPGVLPEYGDHAKLAEKSLGHILGPLAILFYLGFDEYSAEVENTISYFKYYLIARQMNDDAHDWEQDLKKGHLNSSGSEVVRQWLAIRPETAEDQSLEQILPDLQKIFWYETVVEVSNGIVRRTEMAAGLLAQSKVIRHPEQLRKIISSPAASAKEALREREQVLKFLKVYR